MNTALEDEPELLNASAHGDGWIAQFKVRRARDPVDSVHCRQCYLILRFLCVVCGVRRVLQLNDLSELDELMDSEAYAAHVKDSAH